MKKNPGYWQKHPETQTTPKNPDLVEKTQLWQHWILSSCDVSHVVKALSLMSKRDSKLGINETLVVGKPVTARFERWLKNRI